MSVALFSKYIQSASNPTSFASLRTFIMIIDNNAVENLSHALGSRSMSMRVMSAVAAELSHRRAPGTLSATEGSFISYQSPLNVQLK